MSAIFADPDDPVDEHYYSSNQRRDHGYNWQSNSHQGQQSIEFRATDECYDFPEFSVTFENRDKMLRKIVPELVSHRVFDINDIVDGLYSSVKEQSSNPQLVEKMMEGLMTSYISCIHDFKVFILHVGLPEAEVNERVQKSCDFFVLEKQPVKSKSQVMNCLRKIRNQHHHLTMMDPAALWGMMVSNGCFRALKDKPKLLSLCPPGKYLDISEFITDHLSKYNWQPHCYLSTEIDPTGDEEIEDDSDIGSRIRREITAGTYNCLICCDDVHSSDSFWACSGCFRVFHIECMQDWCNCHREGDRSCPMCRKSYSSSDIVRQCWCKKTLNPAVNRQNPGSCGYRCTAVVPESRGLTCTLTCHAGPHNA